MTKNTAEKDNIGTTGYRFGTFKGVFTPSILTILGVVMYLRFGWALGNLGVVQTLIIITIASSITFLTGLSLSALATNMKIEGGGAYFIISRSLGIEAGAAVGLPLFFAQALGISFYTVGFSESLLAINPNLITNLAIKIGLSQHLVAFAGQHSAQIVGITTLLLLTALAYKSADLALKSQFIIMAIILLSLISLFCGGPPAPITKELGVTILPATKHFWTVFAVIFPAVTGIEAGIAMSGDLEDPAKSLPRGTICAVLVGYIIYITIILFLWVSVSDTNLLRSTPMIMQHVARWGKFIILGVWAASLSSVMGALLGSPRTLQALAKDRVIPRIFGRGFGKGNDPRIATASAFFVGLTGIILGDLNLIAPILSMFFLTSYGLLNISAGLEELTGPPSWRPKFRIPWFVSLTGAFLCFAAMLMINAGATFLAATVSISVYFLMEKRSLSARWGDMRSGILMLIARFSIYGLAKRKTDEKTWKPNILVLSGTPSKRWHLIELANAISQDRGFITVAAIVPNKTSIERITSLNQTISDYMDKRNVSALVKICAAESPITGARMLVKSYGYGPIAPNTVLLGETTNTEHYSNYSKLISTINTNKQNMIIVRETEDDPQIHKGNSINIWWYGPQQNLGLMLALVYMLRKSPGWRKASLTLKSIVKSEDERENTLLRLKEFIDRVRLDAEAQILLSTSQNIFEDIKTNSKDADLVFMGMRAPDKEETPDSFKEYYSNLIRNTEGLPPTALVLAAEDMDFYSIFGEV